MEFFNVRRRKTQQKRNPFDEKNDGRRQFNVRIDEDIILRIKEIAKMFRINPST